MIIAANDNIQPEAPFRLADILPVAFPYGGMTVSGLRKEAARGRLTIMRMAGKDFTTLQAIEEMKEKCRVPANPQGSVPSRAYFDRVKQLADRHGFIELTGGATLDEARTLAMLLRSGPLPVALRPAPGQVLP